MRYCTVLLLLMLASTLHAQVAPIPADDNGDRLLAEIAEISSTNPGGEETVLEVLQDGNLETFIHSKDGDKEHEWQYLDLVYPSSRVIDAVVIGFYRWGDSWCEGNPDDCKSTWNRLEGLAVGISNYNDPTKTVSVCDVVAGARQPEFTAAAPQPIYAIIQCNGASGDILHIVQTKPWSVLQLSEVYVSSKGPWSIDWIANLLESQIVYASQAGRDPLYGEWKEWEDDNKDKDDNKDDNKDKDDDDHDCKDCYEPDGAVRMASASATIVAVLLSKLLLA